MSKLATAPAALPNPARFRRTRRAVAGVTLLVAATLAGTVGWLAVGDAADADELARALASYEIAVEDDGGVLSIVPAAQAPAALGVVFLPGTRIEPAAYVATWAPIVEATGVSVHVPAMPLNLPALENGQVEAVMAAHPSTTTWIVGGHSMGGFEAAERAATGAPGLAGLLLWGSGPARTDLAGMDLPSLLVAGGADTILPLDRALREGSLPADATIEVIDGMVHGQFGRYSDTEATQDPTARSDADTLAELASVTTAFIKEAAARADA